MEPGLGSRGARQDPGGGRRASPDGGREIPGGSLLPLAPPRAPQTRGWQWEPRGGGSRPRGGGTYDTHEFGAFGSPRGHAHVVERKGGRRAGSGSWAGGCVRPRRARALPFVLRRPRVDEMLLVVACEPGRCRLKAAKALERQIKAGFVGFACSADHSHSSLSEPRFRALQPDWKCSRAARAARAAGSSALIYTSRLNTSLIR